jgi:hypothetical protein
MTSLPTNTGHVLAAFEREKAMQAVGCEDLYFPQRLRLAWRVTRIWLLREGVLDGPSEPLESVPEPHWQIVLPPEPPADTHNWMTQYLGIVRGLRRTPEAEHGLIGYPEDVRSLHPTREELISYEQALVAQGARILASSGTLELQDHLCDELSMSIAEATAFARLVRAFVSRAYEPGDLEEQRALMLLRLEDVAKRSRDALDLRAELMAVKQISTVLGLGLTAGDAPEREFVDVVTRVSKSHERQLPATEG